MTDTTHLTLPLLAPSQAQKHVTVNEALVRIDAACQMVLKSVSLGTPPALAQDGDAYGVPSGAVNAWDQKGGQIAVYSNGGWVYMTPQLGWRAFVADENGAALFDGAVWRIGGLTTSPNSAGMGVSVTEFDHTVAAGATSTTSFELSPYDLVLGVTGRVMTEVTGTLSDWSLGIVGDTGRYGSSIGLVQGAWLMGVSTHPYAYYSDTALVLSANGGDFASGVVRFAVHRLNLRLPSVA